MVRDIFLAMTAAEIYGSERMPQRLGYMACHFSPYGRGLSNLPEQLPAGSMLILNDRIPISGHDPERIGAQLAEAVDRLACSCLLLDLQRENVEETKALCSRLLEDPPCPVGISESYALDGAAVFLPPVPLLISLEEHCSKWAGREIWLEVAPEYEKFSIREDGCQKMPLPYQEPDRETFREDALHCRYFQEIYADRIDFHIYRNKEDISQMLDAGRTLGITKAVGLNQQWSSVH